MNVKPRIALRKTNPGPTCYLTQQQNTRAVALASCRRSRGHLARRGGGETPPPQPPGRRRYSSLLLLLCSTAGVLFAQQGAAAQAGRITAVIARTSISRLHGPRFARAQAANGAGVAWGDVVQTNTAGRARILLADQSILTLGSDSTLRIVKHDAATQQTALELGYGRIRCQVTKLVRRDSSFQLRTPTSVAGVIGTDFGADSSVPGRTTYICMEGTIRIRNADNRVPGYVDCGPGMTTTVSFGEPPSTPVPATQEQLERWKHITAPADPAFAESVVPLGEGQLLSLMGDKTAFPWLPAASAVKPIRWLGLTISGSWRARLENWNWFADGQANNTYSFLQSILRVGISQRRKNLDWYVELAQPSLLALPDNAVAAAPQGDMGLGATYFLANGNSRNAAYLYPAQAFVRLKNLAGGDRNQLTFGRFNFVDGTETVPNNRALAALKQMRIAHRLIGDFAWSVAGRSQDGALLSWKLRSANLTLAAARPTRGVFQVDGLGSLDVGWAYGALTLPTGGGASMGDLRLFGLGYEDARAVTKTDNRPLSFRTGVDKFSRIRIGTFGAHYLHSVATERAGTFDVLFWGAAQTGDWGLQRHRAGAVAVEAGWQPRASRLSPWFRLGYFISSGGGNPSGNEHNTFSPVLPTPRVYARYPFYNQQNNTDVSALVLLRPGPKLALRSEAHALWLTSRQDLWYQGGGAFQPRTFGYSGRPGGGNRGLGNLWDISADYQFSPQWALGFYYAHVWGKGVMRSIYPNGPNSNFGYTELLYRF